jgi:hypothetical protein
MRILLLALTLLFIAANASAQTCTSTQYDMLEWMAPQVGTVNGHYNVLFPTTGTFYWVKGSAGSPWDVDLFDQDGVYQDITENIWNDPSTFKRFVVPRKWAPRCINIPQTAGVLSTVLHPQSSTEYRIYSSCTAYTTHYLSNAFNQVVGPQNLQIGTLPATPTLSLLWYYGCDANYANCHYHEVFDLQKKNGLVRWTYSVRQLDGSYKIANQTIHSTAQVGSINPVHPCW